MFFLQVAGLNNSNNRKVKAENMSSFVCSVRKYMQLQLDNPLKQLDSAPHLLYLCVSNTCEIQQQHRLHIQVGSDKSLPPCSSFLNYSNTPFLLCGGHPGTIFGVLVFLDSESFHRCQWHM